MAQTNLLLQIIAIAIHILAIIFLVIAAGLFGNVYRRSNNELHGLGISDKCFLYIKKDFTYASNSVCVFSIVGEILAALGLVVLILLSIVKLATGLMGNKIILFVEILILLFSGIFALIVAIILSSGWGVTCDTFNDALKALGSTIRCTDISDYFKQVTASVVFSAFAVAAIVGSSIITILIAVLGPQENNNNINWPKFVRL